MALPTHFFALVIVVAPDNLSKICPNVFCLYTQLGHGMGRRRLHEDRHEPKRLWHGGRPQLPKHVITCWCGQYRLPRYVYHSQSRNKTEPRYTEDFTSANSCLFILLCLPTVMMPIGVVVMRHTLVRTLPAASDQCRATDKGCTCSRKDFSAWSQVRFR